MRDAASATRPGGSCSSGRSARSVEERFADDTVRGVVLTDALIGTFADPHDPTCRQPLLPLPRDRRRHRRLERPGRRHGRALRRARGAPPARPGAEIVTGAEVLAIDPTGEVTFRDGGGEHAVPARHVLVDVPPAVLARLLGGSRPSRARGSPAQGQHAAVAAARGCKTPASTPRGVRRDVPHQRGLRPARTRPTPRPPPGEIPDLPPCRGLLPLADRPVASSAPELAAAGAQTLTLFGLHMPARLFREDHGAARARPLRGHARLDGPRARRADRGLPAARRRRHAPASRRRPRWTWSTSCGLPGGHIFHRDLAWPYAERRGRGRWGVETDARATSCCAARAPGAAAGSAASPATTRPWHS